MSLVPTFSISVQEMYGSEELDDVLFYQLVDRSLNPRSSTMLYDKMGALGLPEGALVLDAGCRDARHTCELVRRFGYRAVGVDLVWQNVVRAQPVIAEAGVVEGVTAVQGNIQQLPLPDNTFQAIWCRDVLTHLPDLHRGLTELARVLQPSGTLLIYQTFATDLLCPAEADLLYPPLAVVPRNMSSAYLEEGLLRAGFQLVEKDVIGSEWREHWEEEGPNTTSEQLLRIARLRRNREALLAQISAINYTVELANCHWGVYQMLGKLCPMAYTVTKPT